MAMATTRRNEADNGFLKCRKLSNTVRVVIEPWFNNKYRVSAQIYDAGYCLGFEDKADGWHNTCSRFSGTVEGAKRVFEEMVREELRWLEQRR